MAANTYGSSKLSVLGVGALAVGVAATIFGAGIAGADPNDPGMTDVRPNGHVDSPQAASTSAAKPCVVDPGTLSTASSSSSDVGIPVQTSRESGPSWVGSHGWNAVGSTNSNPFGGHFNPKNTRTGPQCKTGKAGSAGGF